MSAVSLRTMRNKRHKNVVPLHRLSKDNFNELTRAALDSTYHCDSIFVREYTRGDTVYLNREVQIQLPPERYVPRAVKVLAWIGGAAIGLLLLWVIRDLPTPFKGGVFKIWKGL